MERIILLTLIVLFLMVSSVSALKIATLNMQSGVGTTKGYWQYPTTFWKYFFPHSIENIAKTSELINSEDVDIIAFTEIDGSCFRSKNINQAELISNLTNLKESIFFPTYKIGSILNQGNAINTKFPILSTKSYELPGFGEPRFLGEAVLNVNGTNVSVFVTHLSIGKKSREKQLEYIAEIINNTQGSIILTGDFNILDASELNIIGKTKLEKISNCKTYPSWNPKISTDLLLLSKEFNITGFYSADSVKVSDHLPCIVEATLG